MDTITATAPAATLTISDMAPLAEAIAAVTTGDAVQGNATAALLTLTREAYARVAATYARTVDGHDVLPDSAKADVLAALWREAGHPTAPAAKDRDKGTRTFAQYVSRLARIAVHFDHGVTALTDDDAFAAATDAIKDEADSRAASKALAKTAGEVDAYTAWFDSLPQSDRAALTKVKALFTGTSIGATHAPTFAAALLAATKTA